MKIEITITEKVFHMATIETKDFIGEVNKEIEPFKIAELINEIKSDPNGFIKMNKGDFNKDSEFENVVLQPE